MIGDDTTAADSTSAADRTATAGACHGSVESGSAGANRFVKAPNVRSHSRGTAPRSRVCGGRSAAGVRSPSRWLSDAGSVRHPGRPLVTGGRVVVPVRVEEVEEVMGHDGTGH